MNPQMLQLYNILLKKYLIIYLLGSYVNIVK